MSVAQRKRGDASDGAVGGRLARIDGALKITGGAIYALEHQLENVAYAAFATNPIAAGRVTSVDTAAAESAPGVLMVMTPETDFGLRLASDWYGARAEGAYIPLPREIAFSGQAVAAVVAETFEQATAAAALLKIAYEESRPVVDLDDPRAGEGKLVDQMTAAWGDADAALAASPVRVEAEYRTPREYHVPMEPHGLIAQWEGDKLTVWEPSQWTHGMARVYAEWFGLPYENVRIVSPFVGGGFGSKALVTFYDAIATVAAKRLDRPVKLAVTRPQTFTAYGGRAATKQTIALGATKDGLLQAIVHRGANETSTVGTWVEHAGAATPLMYATPNFSSQHRIVPVNTVTPGALRAPGKNPSAFGIESAMDELAYAVGIDPVDLRLRNYAERDPQSKKPWSTRQMREALTTGAKAFGWARRNPEPRSMRDGRALIGWGVATGTFPVIRNYGEALVRIRKDGSIEVVSGAIDMGQGTYTVLAQTAAEALGVSVDDVEVVLGDSSMPGASVAGGSMLAGVMTGAVHKAATAARDELIGLALSDENSPFRDTGANTLAIADGRIASARGDQPAITIAELMARIGRNQIEAKRDTLPDRMQNDEGRFRAWTTMSTASPPVDDEYSRHSWCAHFVEVRVDEDFGTIRVSRMVSAFDCGRLYNPKLAESQWKGGVIMGVGQALLEEGVVDRRHARVINNSLADYLVPTNADIPDIQVISVGVPDPQASVLGGKGVGEVGIVGVAPAIANAVFHATGKRVRDLPITLEKLI